MTRIMLTVAYDGTNYHGWQVQPNKATIEGELNQYLSALLGEEIRVIGASRTDAGVHALGNIAVFDTNTKISAEKISLATNQKLPADIKIHKSESVPLDFHPRHVESRKTYEYKIWNDKFPMPTERYYSYFVYNSLNLERMQKAAECFVGEHDFTSFCSINTEVESKVRTIYDLKVNKQDKLLTVRVTGNGFLYNMVRIIVGTILDIGKEKYLPDQIETILAGKNRELAGATVPAHGLTLIKYDFLHFPY